MQAEMNGQDDGDYVQASHMESANALPFIEPVELKAELHSVPPIIDAGSSATPATATGDDDRPLWIAVWNTRRSVAYSVDVSTNELEPYERALRSTRQAISRPARSHQKSERRASPLRSWRRHSKGDARREQPPANVTTPAGWG
jgi:hypothetical protein